MSKELGQRGQPHHPGQLGQRGQPTGEVGQSDQLGQVVQVPSRARAREAEATPWQFTFTATGNDTPRPLFARLADLSARAAEQQLALRVTGVTVALEPGESTRPPEVRVRQFLKRVLRQRHGLESSWPVPPATLTKLSVPPLQNSRQNDAETLTKLRYPPAAQDQAAEAK